VRKICEIFKIIFAIILAFQKNSNSSSSAEDSSAETAAEVAAQQQRKRARRQLQRDCGLQDMDNGTYKTVVVVQTNNLGIPGLVTSMDQLYEVPNWGNTIN
jgi:hypothetical protein